MVDLTYEKGFRKLKSITFAAEREKTNLATVYKYALIVIELAYLVQSKNYICRLIHEINEQLRLTQFL